LIQKNKRRAYYLFEIRKIHECKKATQRHRAAAAHLAREVNRARDEALLRYYLIHILFADRGRHEMVQHRDARARMAS